MAGVTGVMVSLVCKRVLSQALVEEGGGEAVSPDCCPFVLLSSSGCRVSGAGCWVKDVIVITIPHTSGFFNVGHIWSFHPFREERLGRETVSSAG